MKKFYRENRIFVIMMGIVLVCFIVIATILFINFYKGSGSGHYGDRLEGIETVEISAKRIKEIEIKVSELKNVKEVAVNISGKIVYMNFLFNEGSDLIESESLMIKTLDNFSEEEKAYYDFQFTLKENINGGFIISGARNKNNSTIVWNNNREVSEEE